MNGGNQLSIHTVLGADKLRIRRFTYSEQLSGLFRLEAELVSPDYDIVFEDVVGSNATVELALGNGGSRYFNGVVSAFTQGQPAGKDASYRLTLVPWLWLLTRTADCRIFQKDKTVPEIIKEVFTDAGFQDLQDHLKASYRPWLYCVQYRETDFNFVSRLMEQEGIYYYWRHTRDRHELVLVDDPTAHDPFPGYDKILYRPEHGGATGGEVIFDWTSRQELQPGDYALNDFNYEKPRALLRAHASLRRQHGHAGFEIYDYPGEYAQHADGEGYAKVRIQELQAQYEVIRGTSNARGLAAGSIFELEEHPRRDQNRSHLLTAVEYSLGAEQYQSGTTEALDCQCSFEAIAARQPFRPPRITPKPLVQGPQTAIVVGPSGEEIYTDDLGRVKVQFHWDRYGKADENSSCWVRVSQLWAGKGWGGMHLPRIGQEVIVEFLEGDPDRPIITGRVYNGEATPPYALPSDKTQSGIKSRSSKGGSGDNFNEIRMEDKKGAEELYIHAEKDQNNVVENDESTRVGHDRTETVGNDEKVTVGNNRTEQVGVNETISIGSNRTETVGANEMISIAITRTRNVGVNDMINVGAAQEITVGGAQATTVGAAQANTVGLNQVNTVGKDRNSSIGKDDSLRVGKKLTIEAGDEILIKTGKASILMKKDGTINIQGKDIVIQGSGAITAKATKDVVIKGKKVLQN